ncbi:glutathione S-transferase-like protein ustS [Favolaschia claudopus]|uniref:Glutathione S-transferase-like protein ustS n=1 Tax=Favolaschia claudopus TaxID=2862362 RepID=A0AAW0D1T4_9AGAR
MILFYDIASSLPTKAWSPNAWKTRLALNHKRIPYKTIWVLYADIEKASRQLGALPTRKKIDGVTDCWTLPCIWDLSTGAIIADSTKIAIYLDATYPASPESPSSPPIRNLMPTDTTFPLFMALEASMLPLFHPLYLFAIPASDALLDERSQTAFRFKREKVHGKPMHLISPRPGTEEDKVEWAKVEAAFGMVHNWCLDTAAAGLRRAVWRSADQVGEDGMPTGIGDVLTGTGDVLTGVKVNGEQKALTNGDGEKRENTYILETLEPTYADLWLGGYLIWIKLVLPAEKWESVCGWHGGRWARLVEGLEAGGWMEVI